MKKDLLGILFICFLSMTINAQNVVDSVNYALKVNDYDKAIFFTKQIKYKKLRSLFQHQIDYYSKGIVNEIDTVFNFESIKNARDSIIYYYLLADTYSINKTAKDNQKIFQYYFLSYKKALNSTDSELINETLRRLISHVNFRVRDTVLSKKYLQEFAKYKEDEADNFWYYYQAIKHNFILKDSIIKENEVHFFKKEMMSSLFEDLFSYSKGNKFHRAIYFQMLGVYQADWLKDYINANINNSKTKTICDSLPFWYAKFKIKAIGYNTAINYYKNEEPRKAIPFFIEDLKRDKEQILIMYTNEWLYKCYEDLKKYEPAHYYFKQMIYVKDRLDQEKHARQIMEIEKKYDLQAKEEELLELASKNTFLNNKLNTITPFLLIFALAALIFFFFYTRYKKRSKVLEKDQSETLQKLDELKNIVIKNHIILKDRTKIYISDLMYIKSDDHYLNVFLSDSKNHFVRGKLSQIKEELPPNFIQCHRSYIVNANFIKQVNGNSLTLIDKTQIPLSRSYKDKF